MDKVEQLERAVGHLPPKAKKPEVKERAKAKPEKPAAPTFPADCRINDYGFLGFKVGWLSELSWHKGMALKIERNADGSATLRKA